MSGYGCDTAARRIMGTDRAAPAGSTAIPKGRKAARVGPGLPHRHPLRATQWYSVADVTARTRLWLGHDMLAPSARLAAREHLEPHSLRAAGLARSRWFDQLVPCDRRQLFRPRRVWRPA